MSFIPGMAIRLYQSAITQRITDGRTRTGGHPDHVGAVCVESNTTFKSQPGIARRDPVESARFASSYIDIGVIACCDLDKTNPHALIGALEIEARATKGGGGKGIGRGKIMQPSPRFEDIDQEMEPPFVDLEFEEFGRRAPSPDPIDKALGNLVRKTRDLTTYLTHFVPSEVHIATSARSSEQTPSSTKHQDGTTRKPILKPPSNRSRSNPFSSICAAWKKNPPKDEVDALVALGPSEKCWYTGELKRDDFEDDEDRMVKKMPLATRILKVFLVYEPNSDIVDSNAPKKTRAENASTS
ncbi:hypothetical protein BDN72DRAFT_864183 [Pluteus cervinus]|uniref:Uncharacterized protein n=1 Tax=Pluteus cervinus TaxID=181527 RepID=A0ACD3A5K2_9AGAR|nr:hypothetical protein BDN72DRAFT_864183 [Pluteus cervinus]